MKHLSIWLFFIVLLFSGCNKKQMESLQNERDRYQTELNKTRSELDEARQQLSEAEAVRDNLLVQQNETIATMTELQSQNADLQEQVTRLTASQSDLLKVLQRLTVVTPNDAATIQESVGVLKQQDEYLSTLAQNLTGSIGPNSDDVQVEIVEGSVLISLSDKLLFPSASADVQATGLPVLGKVAQVVKQQPNLEVVIAGHTDNLPIKTDCLKDNWDLSAKRAGSVLRVLRWRFEIDPERMILVGRAQYDPKSDNSTPTGRQLNRRTEIILRPSLEQLLSLVKAPAAGGN